MRAVGRWSSLGKQLAALAFALAFGVAWAQLAGAYVATVPNGTIDLTLAVAGGSVEGTLRGLGLDLRLNGRVTPDGQGAAGSVTAADGSTTGFEATLAGDGLTLVLFDVDAAGRPNAATAITLAFTRRSTATTPERSTPKRRTTAAAPPTEEVPATPAAPNAPVTSAAPNDLDLPQVVERVHAHASTFLTLADELIVLAIDAGLAAGAQNGSGFATFGTLTENAGGAAYAATPGDALIVTLRDGRSWTIAFLAPPQGDVGDDGGSDFIDAPHVLNVQVRSNLAAGGYDLRLTSQPIDAAQQRITLAGGFDDGGIAWRVDADVTRFRSVVFDGIANVTATADGQIALAAPALGIEATSSQSQRYRLVNVVENVDRTQETRFTWNGAAYALSGRVFVALRESLPVDTDQWVIDGALTGPAGTLGRFAVEPEVNGVAVALNLAGARVPLYFYSY